MTATSTRRTQTPDPDLIELVAIKGRLDLGLEYLRGHVRDARQFSKGRQRLIRIMAREYAPALARVLDAHGRTTLHHKRRQVKARLHRGWAYPRPADLDQQRRVNDLVLDLIRDYEVLTDALTLDSPRRWKRPGNVLFSRIRSIEQGLEERVAVVGSRAYPDLVLVRAYVTALGPHVTVVSGGAAGVDRVAAEVARARGLAVEEYLPDPANGPGQFHARNRQIVAGCDRLVAFWDGSSTGTKYTIDEARRAGKPVEVYEP